MKKPTQPRHHAARRAVVKGKTAAAEQPSWLPAVNWYFDEVLEQKAGQGILPFYCDPKRVGAFAVAPADLAAGGESNERSLVIRLAK